jgi:hypothetical protein
MPKNPTLVLVLGFIAGCGAAVVAPLVIPPAHAQGAPRWEVFCSSSPISRDYSGPMTQNGNAAGAQGWELVGFTDSGTMCFKRPAP